METYKLSAPYYYGEPMGGGSPEWREQRPKMHFRHNGLANVAWCDGHITSERMSYSRTIYGAFNIGFIGENSDVPAIANALYGHHEP